MSAHRHTFRTALRVAFLLLLADLVASVVSILLTLSPSGILGDLLLLEVAALFLTAGLIDFSSSAALLHVRRALLSSTEQFSSSKRKDTERRAMVLVFAGLILLAAMIVLALTDLRFGHII